MNFITLALVTWLHLTPARGHSWVERVNRYHDREVQLAASGYARGNVLRTAQGFSDDLMTYQLPPGDRVEGDLYATDRICSPAQQLSTRGESTRLLASEGSTVVLQYNENGHVTEPENNALGKPRGDPGQVFVYGTSDSRPTDTLQDIHKVWTSDGQGGDKRGRLLYVGPFDDGKCYQASEGSSIEAERQRQYPPPGDADPAQNGNRWCQNHIELPKHIDSTMYTLYWVWDWPFEATASTMAKPQLYTTCIDLDIGVVIEPTTI